MLRLKQATARATRSGKPNAVDHPLLRRRRRARWRAVSTPNARTALESVFDAFIEPMARPRRGRGSNSALILRAYAVDGEAPEISEIAAASGLAPEVVAATLGQLAGRDHVVLDRTGHLSGTHPFADSAFSMGRLVAAIKGMSKLPPDSGLS